MQIVVDATPEEMKEMGFEAVSLTEHLYSAIDADDRELIGYSIEVNVASEPSERSVPAKRLSKLFLLAGHVVGWDDDLVKVVEADDVDAAIEIFSSHLRSLDDEDEQTEITVSKVESLGEALSNPLTA